MVDDKEVVDEVNEEVQSNESSDDADYRWTELIKPPVTNTFCKYFEFPLVQKSETSVKQVNELHKAYFNKEMSFWNFKFGEFTSELPFEGFKQTESEMQKYKDPIAYFKVYTAHRAHYGEKLCGIRCYTHHDRMLLSQGWFQDADVTIYEIKPHERITGFKARFHPSNPAILYDCQFKIQDIRPPPPQQKD